MATVCAVSAGRGTRVTRPRTTRISAVPATPLHQGRPASSVATTTSDPPAIAGQATPGRPDAAAAR
ncbi:hypothetical protein BBN63_34505 [Streptomyces niveus]|uniref:Uncharacterized protein n=1 Tax=Streptomyces niveus TaxID=193462 RepID=A0A1U9R2F1_STRNV|nr:hypothetical protein BBN63_34505 [Streptomyces niveus]